MIVPTRVGWVCLVATWLVHLGQWLGDDAVYVRIALSVLAAAAFLVGFGERLGRRDGRDA